MTCQRFVIRYHPIVDHARGRKQLRLEYFHREVRRKHDGVMASRPYAASGKYIHRMSNYCIGCRYRPENATGEDACPFTTLYWDFLLRHEKAIGKNQRMSLQVKNLKRKSATEKRSIQERAAELRDNWNS